MKGLEGKTNKELVERYNDLAFALGHDALKSWKGKKNVLIGKIKEAQAELDKMREHSKEESAGPERTIRVAALQHLAEVAYYEDKTKKPGPDNVVGADDKNARSVGLTYAEIIRRIEEEFPECETTVACLRWYAVKMRNPVGEDTLYEKYKLPQRRPRAKPRRD